jgi:hypothetical protein
MIIAMVFSTARIYDEIVCSRVRAGERAKDFGKEKIVMLEDWFGRGKNGKSEFAMAKLQQ